jgi:CRISPR/Cas system CSM-associated protein Csm2 small subunit
VHEARLMMAVDSRNKKTDKNKPRMKNMNIPKIPDDIDNGLNAAYATELENIIETRMNQIYTAIRANPENRREIRKNMNHQGWLLAESLAGSSLIMDVHRGMTRRERCEELHALLAKLMEE